jgi:hypothetical protein
MTSPRMIVAGATTAVTRGTTLRKVFLSPWDPLVQQCWPYALADAQRQTGVAIHHGSLVINHEHLMVRPSYDNLPEFTRRLHRGRGMDMGRVELSVPRLRSISISEGQQGQNQRQHVGDSPPSVHLPHDLCSSTCQD